MLSLVGVEAVQQASSARRHYKTKEAWVVANNMYIKNAGNLAELNDIRLIGRNQLIDLITGTQALEQTEKKPKPV